MIVRRVAFFALVLSVAVAAIGDDRPEALRIMPLGDSITRGSMGAPEMDPGGYRKWLYRRMTDAGYAVDFVGSQTLNPAPGMLPDDDHEGHSGFRIDQIAAGIEGWIREAKPDIILLAIGTNDIHQGYQLDTAPQRLSELIDLIRQLSPKVRIAVAALPGSTNNGKNEAIKRYNAAVVKVASGAGEDVTVVDLFSQIDLPGDIADARRNGLHPTRTGYYKIAQAWFDAICRIQPPPSTDYTRDAAPRLLMQMDETAPEDRGIELVDGRIGKAWRFGPQTPPVELPDKDVLPARGDFTVRAWIRTTSANANQYILSTYASPQTDGRFGIHIHRGRFGVFVNSRLISTNRQVNDGGWHQIEVIRWGTHLLLRVDGVPEVAVMNDAIDNGHPWHLGNRQDGLRPFEGDLDQLEVWHEADLRTPIVP